MTTCLMTSKRSESQYVVIGGSTRPGQARVDPLRRRPSDRIRPCARPQYGAPVPFPLTSHAFQDASTINNPSIRSGCRTRAATEAGSLWPIEVGRNG